MGGMTSMLVAPEAAHLSPIEFTMVPSGFLRQAAKGITGAFVAGVAGAASFFTSSLIVDALWDKKKAAESSNKFGQLAARPILFAASAVVLGAFTHKMFKGRTLLTAAVVTGAGVRALAGILHAFVDRPEKPGIAQDLYDSAASLSGDDDGMQDYLQMGDDQGDAYAGTADYLQMGEMHEAGLGAMYEAGLGYDYHEEEVESAAAPF